MENRVLAFSSKLCYTGKKYEKEQADRPEIAECRQR